MIPLSELLTQSLAPLALAILAPLCVFLAVAGVYTLQARRRLRQGRIWRKAA